MEFALEHPSALVTGVDLSPVQSDVKPSNCTFAVADIEQEWSYGHRFDYIHGRFLSMGIRDWAKIFKQSFENLKPGGWVEYQEAELTFPVEANSPKSNQELRSLSNDVQDAALEIGVDVRQAHSWKDKIVAAGFTDHHMLQLRWPLGEWSVEPREKVIGRMNRLNMLNGIEGLTMAYLVRVSKQPVEEVRERLARVKEEMKDADVHQYMNL